MVAIRRCLADRGSAALRGATLYTSELGLAHVRGMVPSRCCALWH
jgi:hypothetical protein